MSVAINGTDGITFNDGSLQPSAIGKNLIINGDMRIAQRGTSSTGITGTDYYTCDRYRVSIDTAGTWTQSQDTDAPEGFSNSLKMQCTTADVSLGASDVCVLNYRMEGQNLQHLKKGTASAESLTLSFWVKSNKTGTYIVEIDDNDNSRNINNAYTITAADTWEKKTLTFSGDTIGTLNNDNGNSLQAYWWFAAGSNYTSGTLQTSWGSTVNADRAVGNVNLADSTSNYINITGVQLEANTTATPFEHLQYGQQLALCQRYYYLHCEGDARSVANGAMFTSSVAYANIKFPVNMRADPSIEVASATNFRVFAGNGASNATSVSLWSKGGTTNEFLSLSGLSRTQGQACFVDTNNAACKLAFSSEL